MVVGLLSERITDMNTTRRMIMKENRVGFFAGLAGAFGLYFAWEIVAAIWQTATATDAVIKSVIGFVLGMVVGILLYLGVYSLANKKGEATISKRITRYTIFGIVAGLVIAFFLPPLFFQPTGSGPAPLFPIKPLFPLK
jgi:cobalamin synthase